MICADGGARHLDGTGIIPDLIVGDMDSLDSATLQSYEAKGCRIIRQPFAAADVGLVVVSAVAVHLEVVGVGAAAAAGMERRARMQAQKSRDLGAELGKD